MNNDELLDIIRIDEFHKIGVLLNTKTKVFTHSPSLSP